jgi:hypothetical protein
MSSAASCERDEDVLNRAAHAAGMGASALSMQTLNAAGRRTYLALFFGEHLLGQARFARWLGAARERNRARMLAYFAGWPQDAKQPVREVRFTTHARFYRTHAPAWEPAVFRGLATEWPAAREWSLEFFARHYGSTRAVSIDQHGLLGDGETPRYEVSTLGKLIAGMQAGRKECLRFSPLIDENPQLKDYLDMRWLAGFRSPLSVRGFPQFFLGPAGTYTPMHCALESNAFVQVHGRKRWILYPARYQPLLEPPADRRPYFHADFLPERGAPEFQLGRYAPALEVVLDPGDVLYVPPFVWHYVENVTTTIAVAYRFFSLRAAVRSSWPLTVAKFLATRPSLLHTLVCPRRALDRRCRVPGCPFALPQGDAERV